MTLERIWRALARVNMRAVATVAWGLLAVTFVWSLWQSALDAARPLGSAPEPEDLPLAADREQATWLRAARFAEHRNPFQSDYLEAWQEQRRASALLAVTQAVDAVLALPPATNLAARPAAQEVPRLVVLYRGSIRRPDGVLTALLDAPAQTQAVARAVGGTFVGYRIVRIGRHELTLEGVDGAAYVLQAGVTQAVPQVQLELPREEEAP